MAGDEAFTAVRETLAAGWTLTDTVYENEDYTPRDDPRHFVFVEVYGDLFAQASLGAEPQADNLWREAGMVYMHVMTLNGIGSSTARQYARQLVGLFKGQEIDGVRFRDASIGAGEPGRDFGNYFAMTATVAWERDE